MIDPSIHAYFLTLACNNPLLMDCSFWITPFSRITQTCLALTNGMVLR